MQIIVFTNAKGFASIIHPSSEWFSPDEEGNVRTIEQLAEKEVPEGLEWRIAKVEDLPKSRNWRNAWTDANDTDTVDVDLTKAKVEHRKLIVAKAFERVGANEFGEQDFALVAAEIAELALDQAPDLQTLFNLWPSSIEKRTAPREYQMHEAA